MNQWPLCQTDKHSILHTKAELSYARIQTWALSDSNMGKWMFVYREIRAAPGDQSQPEQLGVLGLDQSINKLSLDYLIGQLSRDMRRSQRTDTHRGGQKGRGMTGSARSMTQQRSFFWSCLSAGCMIFLSSSPAGLLWAYFKLKEAPKFPGKLWISWKNVVHMNWKGGLVDMKDALTTVIVFHFKHTII